MYSVHCCSSVGETGFFRGARARATSSPARHLSQRRRSVNVSRGRIHLRGRRKKYSPTGTDLTDALLLGDFLGLPIQFAEIAAIFDDDFVL